MKKRRISRNYGHLASKPKFWFSGLAKSGLTVLISVLVITTVAKAGSLTPSASPAATSYTLANIYTRLTTNATATDGGHAFSPGGVPAATFYTLKEIYDIIPTIDSTKILVGTSYLGIAGAMLNIGQQIITPSTTQQAINQGYHNGTGYVAGDADLTADNIKSGVNIFGVAGNVIKSLGDAVAGNVLSGKIFSNAGAAGVTGTMANNGAFSLTASSSDQTVAEGYYSGGTLVGAINLIAANIKSGENIFGVIGNLVAGYLYGSSDASQVLTSAGAGAGTYNANNLSTATVKKDTAFGVSSTGAYSGYPGTGWSGTAITQATCDAQNPTWYWFADGNGDGDTTDAEDGVCIRATPVTSLSWNGAAQIGTTNITAQAATAGTANSITKGSAVWTVNAYANEVVKITTGTAINCWGVVKSNTTSTITVYGSWLSSAYASNCGTPDATSVFTVARDGFDDYDNSWIGDWTCTGSFPSGAPSWGSFPTSAQVGAGFIALATTDCYDGTRDLLPTEASRVVKTGTATATSTTSITDSSLSLNTNAWVGQKVLITGGTGSGGYGRIESNTGTVITVGSWTGGTPDVGSTFAIVYLIPHADYNLNTSVTGGVDDALNGNNGPLTPEVLNNWKGAKLPTASDFFGFCGYKGNGSAAGTGSYSTANSAYTPDKTFGNYGGQVGRTDEFLDLNNSGSWEWLSEQHYSYSARFAGGNACSGISTSLVNNGYRFRAVFRQ